MAAGNAFDALVVSVNAKISEMNTAISEANGAAVLAGEAAASAAEAVQDAEEAAQAAQAAAEAADEERESWENLTVEADTAEAGAAASAVLDELGGNRRLTFTIPRGNPGADGQRGEAGRSGVTFNLIGTSLYMTTEA